MAKKRDYTITVVSESLYQYDNKVQAPFTLGGPFGPVNLRLKCAPYLAGSFTAIDRDMRKECFPYPQTFQFSAISPGGHVYAPFITYEQFISTPLISDGGQLYNPTFALTLPMELQSPGGQLYNPTFGLTVPMVLQTPGAELYVPTLVYDQTLSTLVITPGAQLYNPTLGLTLPMALQSPGGQLYNPTFALTTPMPLLTPGGQLYNPTFGLTLPMALQSPGGQLYIPTVTQASVGVASYTEIVSASNPNGTTAMHIGSLYLEAQTYTIIGVLINELKYSGGGKKAYVELKRFTNGATLTQLSAEGAASYQYAIQADVVVATADWYDIYLSGTDVPSTVTDATSSIRGVYYEY